MKTNRINAALYAGCLLHAIMRANGTVGVSVQKDGQIRGYGDASSTADAMLNADRYIETGGWYKEEGLRLQGVTSDNAEDIAARLDAWQPQRARAFIAWRNGDKIAVRLSGMHRVVVPNDVLESVMDTGFMATWSSDRGYVYRTAPDPERPMAGCIMSVVCSSPNNSTGDDGLGWQYPTMQFGVGADFWEALSGALSSEVHEVPSPQSVVGA
ncbi:MAG: hypothetical protein UY31_C0056G0006 [Candidatus Wolfebacteria bacterium GW2011_GWE1_48_7]|uniref:Uncharacterized protein n=2 Tax=Candidatus Wolfeibacteriota TaxID=1752735 RepID=A0A0G1U5T7_9BACT|nr:MAG: hypothetical protein UX70_C0001G0594 [Candidatus Wolfebacteria bacterium GW2011_GWB1_47_1]KKU36867.1 MAG: hypothetical protein UX49_C0007G0026 [Candidatus Wolfebacteria bacterium GW2011_GWC2_46_275]KKU42476.1 MAG: hypothetical protein UX58_C0002G0190 [Candidatus Wolfebacteria bacterium GW2011_GWB2_46_69]KKU54261.1 MAG: hypothetical protein UX76_C0004G0065 [Candidatus Wolfebacteria bacterium GW2011_GWC1_47_103]KKU59629.1 MAG: hypothetical protein UX83_C0003G0044 [Candidatus Wolfebacteria